MQIEVDVRAGGIEATEDATIYYTAGIKRDLRSEITSKIYTLNSNISSRQVDCMRN